jgi:hypothetical protein
VAKIHPTDLIQRRDHATANGWKGEIEGIDLILTFLRSKRTQAAVRSASAACPCTVNSNKWGRWRAICRRGAAMSSVDSG